jgi:predicted dehydrogenase
MTVVLRNVFAVLCGAATLLSVIVAHSQTSPAEETINFMMKFPSGILATCGSSYGQSGTNFLQMNGTTGHLRLEPAFTYGSTVLRYTGTTAASTIEGNGPVYDPDQFVTEATHFADCILNDKEPMTSGEEGLKDLIAIESIYAATGDPASG